MLILNMATGLVISHAVMVFSSQYVFALRMWVEKTGWMDFGDGLNPEDDPSYLGQIIPKFMVNSMFVNFWQSISGKPEHAAEQTNDKGAY
ncbi:hypothetical protein BJ170DRAFT_605806 [Xylariales sp. AK1849]|nr:hypothetical protein BJ170DRAFT_605806 [Xylariales sp. AK1849]